VPYVVTLPLGAMAPSRESPARAVPNVLGLAVREAVRDLHRAGLQVRLIGTGRVSATLPAAGSMVRQNTAVRLKAAP